MRAHACDERPSTTRATRRSQCPSNTRGAIMRSAPGKWEVVDLVVDDPQAGELQVKLAASGLCHSDDHVATGDMPGRQLPVPRRPRGRRRRHHGRPEHARASRRATTSSSRSCPPAARCRCCANGQQYLCDSRREPAGRLAVGRPDELPPQDLRRRATVGQMCGLGTFAEITTVDVRLDGEDRTRHPARGRLPRRAAASAPAGAPRSRPARSSRATRSIVMGIGGIGINAVQGAAHAGASHVIAVDPVAFKREKAHGARRHRTPSRASRRPPTSPAASPTARAPTRRSSPSA